MKISLTKKVIFLLALLVAVTCSQKKILILPFWAGTHFKYYKQLALQLVEKNYDVTIMLPENSKDAPALINTQVKATFIPGVTQDLVEAQIQLVNTHRKPEDSIELFSLLLKSTVNDPNWIQQLRDEKYDMLIRAMFPPMNDLAHMLQIPHNILSVTSLLENSGLRMNMNAPTHSTQFSVGKHFVLLGYPDLEDPMESSFWSRFTYYLPAFALDYILYQTLEKHCYKTTAPEYRHFTGREPLNDLVITVGAEGVLTQASFPPHVKSVFPFVKGLEGTVKPLPEELSTFIDSHEHIILIAFGSSYQPNGEFLQMVLQVAKNNNNYGIILQLREERFEERLVAEINGQSNIFNSRWLPQTDLLKSGRVGAFFSHGGYGSLLEALEAAVPQLVTPLVLSDQQTNCLSVQREGLGKCMGEPTYLKMEKGIKMVLNDKEMKEKLAHVSKVMKQKREDPFDTLYWIDYVFDVGTQHLIPKDTLQLSYFQLLELDIHLALFALCLALVLTPVLFLWLCFKCLCGSKNQDQKKNKTD